MSKSIDKIKAGQVKGTFLKTSNTFDVKNEKVSFSFENFNSSSVKNNRIYFNNYYQNIESSRNAVGDFFRAIKELSKYEIGKLMSDIRLKEAFHLKQIDRNEHINRIEDVLKTCYRYPEEKIEQFDREYYEFQISDGKRVIWHKVDNIICPLFVDCNHMICIESCRSEKMKMNYSVESSFSHLGERELTKKDKSIIEFIKMIVSDYEKDDSISASEIVDVLKEIINYDF